MHRRLFFMAVLLFVAASAFAQTTVRCESTDGRYRECDMDGFGRVALTRHLSDASCIEGESWGYRDGKVWVSKGCRAEFALTERSFRARTGGRIVTCESQDGKRQVCQTSTTGGVAVAMQLSQSSCVQGRSWGYDKNGIWVDEGCRAQFVVGGGKSDFGRPFERLDQIVRCESVDGKPQRCTADTRSGVQVVRQISSRPCGFGREWGYDDEGIWVVEGCRAEFAVRSAVARNDVRQERREARREIRREARQETAYVPNLVCESENNTRKHCRTDTRHGITLVRQLSDNTCVRDRTWGVDRDGVWVTGGCRAEFTWGHQAPLAPMVSSAPAPLTFVCESQDGRRNHCAADVSMGVRLYRQLSDSDCLLNSTWGFDANGVWVSGGCRAEFALGEGRIIRGRMPQAGRVMCESVDGKRTLCPADTRMGVAVVRQVSEAPCVLNSTWGYDTDGIWVTAGCRAEFVLRK
jgi:hypothetical protein